MKKLWFVCIFILFLVGCSSESELSYSDVEMDSLDPDIRAFFESVADTNGNYLYYSGEDNLVVR
ncbi:hypothetical protein [Paraliobacillus sediminis]|uniref:hypothetical protein n=1 Tax=Paraliobacillus sediminis TaxID=1885916 RepID=UPI000E3E80E2|nr:hypothetical protein [Paraliobacillus sediminis]